MLESYVQHMVQKEVSGRICLPSVFSVPPCEPFPVSLSAFPHPYPSPAL